jgi:hypothetical protein
MSLNKNVGGASAATEVAGTDDSDATDAGAPQSEAKGHGNQLRLAGSIATTFWGQPDDIDDAEEADSGTSATPASPPPAPETLSGVDTAEGAA